MPTASHHRSNSDVGSINDLSASESSDNDDEKAGDDDDGFGDDFDDFEEGQEAEDADFGEFDDGFQEDVKSPAFESSPAPPAPSHPTIVSTVFRYDIDSTHDHYMKRSELLTLLEATPRHIVTVKRHCNSTDILRPVFSRSLSFVLLLRSPEYRTC